MAPRHSSPAAAVLAVLALAGCGTSDDRAQARGATERFMTALRHGDGRAACAELSSDLVKQIESQEGKRCAQAVGGLGLRPGAIGGVEVFVTSAKVDLGNGQSEFLDRGASGWQLSALGCAPQGGKPADEPYDCEVQA